MSRNQSSLDTCNENAFAAAHAQLARANENPLAVKITSLPHSPVQPLAGSTFSVRVPIAPDVAVPVNYSSLLSVSDSCDDVPSPPKSTCLSVKLCHVNKWGLLKRLCTTVSYSEEYVIILFLFSCYLPVWRMKIFVMLMHSRLANFAKNE